MLMQLKMTTVVTTVTKMVTQSRRYTHNVDDTIMATVNKHDLSWRARHPNDEMHASAD